MIAAFLFYAPTFAFFIYILIHLTWRWWIRKLSFIPNAPNVPWLGTLPYMGGGDSTSRHEAKRKFDEQFDHMYVSWITFIPVVNIGRVEYAEAVLRSQETITKTSFVDLFREWLGDGLAFSTGTKWKGRRVALTPAFHFAVLHDFVEIFENHAVSLVDNIATSGKSDSIEVQRLAKLSTLDVICETSMGVSVDALNSNSDYVEAVDQITKCLFKRFSNPLTLFSKTINKMTSNGKQYYKYLNTIHQFTRKVIQDNLASRRNEAKQTDDPDQSEKKKKKKKKKRVLMDVLLDMYEQGDIDMAGVQEEVDTFMFAGHDTTSTTLSWTLYEIGRHPHIQQKLQDEIAAASSAHSSLIDRIRSLKYMECVIKESLRLHPPVGAIGRQLERDTVVNNQDFPKGTILVIDTFSMHLNKKYWDDPYTFDPERFNGNEAVKRNPYCFVPFSAGPRNCIGQKYALMEEKVFLYYLLSRFDVTSLQTPDEVIIGTDAITYSKTGIYIKFSPRD